uniref:Uncharacterized protein n=1 Tax=Clytia hemisphaerica TaxID=252671 RepID=A0A7M5WN00_9CNID|eukprot:TCONS_00069831-protein
MFSSEMFVTMMFVVSALSMVYSRPMSDTSRVLHQKLEAARKSLIAEKQLLEKSKTQIHTPMVFKDTSKATKAQILNQKVDSARQLGIGSTVRDENGEETLTGAKLLKVACRMRCGSSFSECISQVENSEEAMMVCHQGRQGCIKECRWTLRSGMSETVVTD